MMKSIQMWKKKPKSMKSMSLRLPRANQLFPLMVRLKRVRLLIADEMFDFDETIPGGAVESDTTGSRSSSSPDSPVQPVRSPLFAPPLSPFRRRSMEKYHLPDDEDPFDDPSLYTKSNGVQTEEKAPEDELPALASSRPIAITPPSRSFLAEGLGVDEEEDEGGLKGLIERISLKNTRSGPRASFADQKMLWDIPGD